MDILEDLPTPPEGYPTTPPVLVDCAPAARQATAPEATKGTRHYHVNHYFARDFGELISTVPTGLMRADGLTKPLGRIGHRAVLETVSEITNHSAAPESDESDSDYGPVVRPRKRAMKRRKRDGKGGV